MIDQETFENLLPLAYQWAKTQEEFILAHGTPLSREHIADARRTGVQNCARVRILVVDRIPLPDDNELAEAAQHTDIITAASRAVTIGYGIIIRAEFWGDRELMLHQLVHVAQCERSGDLELYLKEYLADRQTCAQFTVGTFEDEARRLAHKIVCSSRDL